MGQVQVPLVITKFVTTAALPQPSQALWTSCPGQVTNIKHARCYARQELQELRGWVLGDCTEMPHGGGGT
jgi:hypothetical protein